MPAMTTRWSPAETDWTGKLRAMKEGCRRRRRRRRASGGGGGSGVQVAEIGSKALKPIGSRSSLESGDGKELGLEWERSA